MLLFELVKKPACSLKGENKKWTAAVVSVKESMRIGVDLLTLSTPDRNIIALPLQIRACQSFTRGKIIDFPAHWFGQGVDLWGCGKWVLVQNRKSENRNRKIGVIAPGQAWERGMKCNEYL
jgi:hypothetical protein